MQMQQKHQVVTVFTKDVLIRQMHQKHEFVTVFTKDVLKCSKTTSKGACRL